MKFLRESLSLFLSCCLLFVTAPGVSVAQVDQSAAQPPVQAAQQTPEQLQQLVAPIALYPDALVAQILAAATYTPTKLWKKTGGCSNTPTSRANNLAKKSISSPGIPA